MTLLMMTGITCSLSKVFCLEAPGGLHFEVSEMSRP